MNHVTATGSTQILVSFDVKLPTAATILNENAGSTPTDHLPIFLSIHLYTSTLMFSVFAKQELEESFIEELGLADADLPERYLATKKLAEGNESALMA